MLYSTYIIQCCFIIIISFKLSTGKGRMHQVDQRSTFLSDVRVRVHVRVHVRVRVRTYSNVSEFNVPAGIANKNHLHSS